MARQREEDADLHLSDTLEEIGDDGLSCHHEEHQHIEFDTACSHVYERLVGCEDTCYLPWESHGKPPSYKQDAGGDGNSQPEYAHHAVVFHGTVVVAGNGLHALVHTDDKHEEHHGYAVGDGVGTHGHVAAIAHELIVHENHHDTCRGIH